MLHPLLDLGIQTLTPNPMHATTMIVLAAGLTNVMVLHALSALLPEITLSKDVAHSFTVSPPQPASLQTDSLFFVTDRLTSTNFLVDTGAASAHSLFPYAVAIEYNILQSSSQPLQALEGGYVPVLGTYKSHVDLGFSRLFEHEFCVVEMDFGILGADFLTQQTDCRPLFTEIDRVHRNRTAPEILR